MSIRNFRVSKNEVIDAFSCRWKPGPFGSMITSSRVRVVKDLIGVDTSGDLETRFIVDPQSLIPDDTQGDPIFRLSTTSEILVNVLDRR